LVCAYFLVSAALIVTAPAFAAGPASPGPNQHQGGGEQAKPKDQELTNEQKMQRRFPHPVRVGDLIGLPVLDYEDSTLGYVRQVVRSPDGKLSLIVPYSSWFGWARTEWGKRPVAIPIETVVILARQINSIELSREDIDELPAWQPSQGQPVSPEEKTLIALGRR
jgi:hypothetical protein